MAKSLKGKNRLPLLAVLAANLLLFYTAVQKDAIFAAHWPTLLSQVGDLIPAGVGLVVIGIVNAQLSAEAKARIIFLRWKCPLPGCEAFTRYGPKDHRVDLKSIERKFGLLPADPVEQNRLWYRIYKSVETDASVQDAHGDFLFSRDYACLSLFIAIILGTAGFLQIPSTTTALVYFGVLVLQFLMTWRAARDRGCRLVTNVLAVQGAKG